MQTSSKLIAACIIASLIGLPTLSFAKARGEVEAFRADRVVEIHQWVSEAVDHEPIRRTAPSPLSNPPPPDLQRHRHHRPRTVRWLNPPRLHPLRGSNATLLAGIAGGLAGTWLGHMLFGATESSAKTTDAESGSASAPTSGNSFGFILLLMALGAGAFYFFRRSKQTPAPVFTGLSRSTSARGASSTFRPTERRMRQTRRPTA